MENRNLWLVFGKINDGMAKELGSPLQRFLHDWHDPGWRNASPYIELVGAFAGKDKGSEAAESLFCPLLMF